MCEFVWDRTFNRTPLHECAHMFSPVMKWRKTGLKLLEDALMPRAFVLTSSCLPLSLTFTTVHNGNTDFFIRIMRVVILLFTHVPSLTASNARMAFQIIRSVTYSSGGSFPFGKSGDSPFYFPDREKTIKIFPVREIKWSILICLSKLPGG